jgi:phage terminase small subunit
MNELTTKQYRFVEEYVVDFDATKAAIRSGYSKHTAGVIGCENLTKPKIKSAIQKHLKGLSTDTFITRELIMSGILKEAMDRSEGSTHASRVSAWGKLAKVSGLYVETQTTTTIDDIIRDITERNSESMRVKGLLPKNHINFEDRMDFDNEGNVIEETIID